MNSNLQNQKSSPMGRALNQGTSLFRKSFGRIALILIVAFLLVSNANAQLLCSNPPEPNIIAYGNTTFCDGSNVLLDAGSYAYYSWSTGDLGEFIYATTTGTYCVTVTDGNGCTGVACIDITVDPNPTPYIFAYGNTTFCDGGDVLLDAGYYAGYYWSTGDYSEYIDVTASGTYCVTVTDWNGCTGVSCIDITVDPNPTPYIYAYGNTTFCEGGDVLLDAGNYAAYFWSTGDNGEFVDATTSGTYCVTVTDWNGCTGVACIDITVDPNPTPYIYAYGNTTFCDGSDVLLDAGYYAGYYWSTGDYSEYIDVTASGTYCVTVTDWNGCTGVSCIDITVDPNPTPYIYAFGNTTFCEGGDVLLDAGNYAAYFWSTGDNGEFVDATTSGTYCVTVTDWNGCTGVACIDITVDPNPTPYIYAFGNTTFCD